MKKIVVTLGLFLLAIAGGAHAPVVSAQAAWKTLFDGKSLDQWTPIGNANWKVADGAVQADMGTGFLVSKAMYGDFELRAEIWVNDEANSGIFIREEDPKDISSMKGYEVNIFDKRPDQAYRTGAIVDVAKPAAQINAGGRWNTMEIAAKGSHFTIKLNGVTTVADAQDAKHPRGFIALQYGAGTVRFRKVEIR